MKPAHFKDWFGQKFIFEGLVDKIESEMTVNDIYLIFKMQDDQGNATVEKRFLFTKELKSIRNHMDISKFTDTQAKAFILNIERFPALKAMWGE